MILRSPHITGRRHRYRVSKSEILFVSTACVSFCVQPFFSLLSLIIIVLSSKKATALHLNTIIILGSVYIALVNLTKVHESDLINYLQSFNSAGVLSYTKFMAIYTREPLYYSLVFVLGNISFIKDKHFIFINSFLPYVIFLSAVLRLCLHLELNKKTILLILVVLLFFPQLFSLSAHLLRQFSSSALCIYVIVGYLTTGRVSIVIALASFFIHFFISLFFYIMVAVKLSYIRRMPVFLVYIWSLILMGVSLYLLRMASQIVDLPVVFIPLISRIIDPTGAIDFGSLGAGSYTLIVTIFCVCIYNITFSARNEKTENFYIVHLAIITFTGLIFICSFVPAFSEVTLRFSMLLYFLCGIFLPYTYKLLGKFFKQITFLISVIVIVQFLTYTQSGPWQYASTLELLLWSPWHFWYFDTA